MLGNGKSKGKGDQQKSKYNIFSGGGKKSYNCFLFCFPQHISRRQVDSVKKMERSKEISELQPWFVVEFRQMEGGCAPSNPSPFSNCKLVSSNAVASIFSFFFAVKESGQVELVQLNPVCWSFLSVFRFFALKSGRGFMLETRKYHCTISSHMRQS